MRRFWGSVGVVGIAGLLVFGQIGGGKRTSTGALASSTYAEGYQAAGGYADAASPPAPVDTFRVVLTIDPNLTYDTSLVSAGTQESAQDRYAWAIANADTVLQLGVDVPFSYGYVDQANPTVYNNLNLNNWLVNGGPSGTWETDLSSTTNNRRLQLIYVDWSAFLPANCTIDSAAIMWSAAANCNIDNGDSVMSTLMTIPADSSWYQAKGNHGLAQASLANWNWQAPTSTSTGTAAWSPILNDRDEWIDWGDVSDAGPGRYTRIDAYSWWPAPIKNCVQAVINGAVNNGIMTYFIEQNATVNAPNLYHFETSADRPPWIEIVYTTQRYVAPFAGHEFAFTFSTDDGRIAFNDSLVNVYSEFPGARYTIFLSKKHYDYGTALGYWDEEKCSEWRASGSAEIGFHTIHHTNPAGLRTWGASGAMPAGVPLSGDAAWDSLIVDASPNWLYGVMQVYDGDDHRADRYFGRSIALPLNEYDGAVEQALAFWGYDGWRTDIGANRTLSASRVNLPNGNPVTVFAMLPTATAADSAIGGLGSPDLPMYPRNLDLSPLTVSLESVVGDTSDTPSAAEIKAEVRRRVRRLLASGQRELEMFGHDLKKGSSGSAGDYSAGIEGYEARAILQQVYDMGGVAMCVGDAARAKKQWATPVATPPTWGQDPGYRWEPSDRRMWIRWPGRKNPRWDVPTPPTTVFAVGSLDGPTALGWTGATNAVSYNLWRSVDSDRDNATLYKQGITITGGIDNGSVSSDSTFWYWLNAVSADGIQSELSSASASARFYADADSVPSVQPAMTVPVLANFDAEWHGTTDVHPWQTDGIPYSDIARLDMKVFQPSMWLDQTVYYDTFEGMVDSIRVRNPDFICLTYIYIFGVGKTWNTTMPSLRFGMLTQMCEDNDFFLVDVDSNRLDGSPSFSNYWLLNPMAPGIADSLANFYADWWAESSNMRPYTGFFMDYVDTTFLAWQCGSGSNCDDIADMDGDGVPYSADSDEQAFYRTYADSLAIKMRAAMEDRLGDDKVVLVMNGNAGRAADVAANLDGLIYEEVDQYTPYMSSADKAAWVDGTFTDQLSTAVLPKPIVWMDIHRSGDDPAGASLAFAYIIDGGAGGGFDPGFYPLRYHYTFPFYDWDLGSPTGPATASGDTLTRVFTGGQVRLVWDAAYEFPYLCTSTAGDTLMRGGGWPRAAGPDITPPTVPTMNPIINGQGLQVIDWSEASEDGVTFRLYRGAAVGGVPAATTLFKEGITNSYFQWSFSPDFACDIYDTSYTWQVVAVDSIGNASAKSGRQTDAPEDVIAPLAPYQYTPKVYNGAIEVTWTDLSGPTYLTYNVYASEGDSTSYALADEDLVNPWAYIQATNGVTYYIKVRATDCAGNVGPYSNQQVVTGSTYVLPSISDVTISALAEDTGFAQVHVAATFSKSMPWRLVWKFNNQDWPDTTGMAWQTAAASLDLDVTTGYPWNTSDSDSSYTLHFHEGDPAPTNGYLIYERIDTDGAGFGSWSVAADTTGVASADTTKSLSGRRAIIDNYVVAVATGGYRSAVAVADSFLFNDVMQGSFYLIVDDGTNVAVTTDTTLTVVGE